MMKVTREFSFEAAHMLSGYSGPCKNLHGHSYKLQVSVERPPKFRSEDADSEMVMDFNDLKHIVNEYVISKVDHAIIFSALDRCSEAEEELLKWAQKYDLKYVVLNGRCTAETIAVWIRSQILREISGTIRVRLWETEKSFTEV